MDLTLGIVICDKDKDKFYKGIVEPFISSDFAKQHTWEILVYSNCTSIIDDIDNCKIISNDGVNKFQFEGRREIISKATGDYIYFADGDDNINCFPSDILDSKADMITFPFNSTGVIFDKYWWLTEAKRNISTSINTEFYNDISFQLWNTIIKTNILSDNLELYLEPNKIYNIVSSEDTIIKHVALRHSTVGYYYYSEKPIYTYVTETSTAATTTLTLEKFKHLAVGKKDSQIIMDKIMDNTTIKKLGWKGKENSYTYDLMVFFDKMLIIEPESDQEAAWDIIVDIFGTDRIKKVLMSPFYVFDRCVSKEELAKLNKFLDEHGIEMKAESNMNKINKISKWIEDNPDIALKLKPGENIADYYKGDK